MTYSELTTLISNYNLVPGQTYRLSDYMTTYIQPVTGTAMSSGIVEPLYIIATDFNKVHNVCKSELYPEDIIYYSVIGDLGDGFGTEGFTKGKIYRRIDTIYNNDIGTDWRHIKYYIMGSDLLFIENYGQYINNNTIKTYNLFHSVFNGPTNSYIQDNTIGGGFYGNTIAGDFYYNLISYGFNGNNIGNLFHSNTINANCILNTIGDNFNKNNIGQDFGSNYIVDQFTSNTIGSSFYSNTFSSIFISNIFGDNCRQNLFNGSTTKNNCGNNFEYNFLGEFNKNSIGNEFLSNSILYCYDNRILKMSKTVITGYLDSSSIDYMGRCEFTNIFNTKFSSTIISLTTTTSEMSDSTIDLTVYKAPGGAHKQRHYSDADSLVITNI